MWRQDSCWITGLNNFIISDVSTALLYRFASFKYLKWLVGIDGGVDPCPSAYRYMENCRNREQLPQEILLTIALGQIDYE
jgi:hypothetical protein